MRQGRLGAAYAVTHDSNARIQDALCVNTALGTGLSEVDNGSCIYLKTIIWHAVCSSGCFTSRRTKHLNRV